MVEIKVGSIVSFQGGYFRVTKVTKNTVNLGSIFGNSVYYKGVLKELVKEDETSWYANWQQSETYMSM
jgi:hypothetical protein